MKYIVIALLLFPCCAMAEDGTDLAKTIGELVGQAATVVIMGAGTWVLAKLKEKLGMEVSEKQQAELDDMACKAAGYAEEWAAKKVKETGDKIASEQKLEVAAKWLAMKVPRVDETEAKGIIESVLPFLAMGATALLTPEEPEIEEPVLPS